MVLQTSGCTACFLADCGEQLDQVALYRWALLDGGEPEIHQTSQVKKIPVWQDQLVVAVHIVTVPTELPRCHAEYSVDGLNAWQAAQLRKDLALSGSSWWSD